MISINFYLKLFTILDDDLGAIALNVIDTRDTLWAKTKKCVEYIYKTHLNEYDWFLKADDDTYVVMENLRYMLYNYSAETPIFFGCEFHQDHPTEKVSFAL